MKNTQTDRKEQYIKYGVNTLLFIFTLLAIYTSFNVLLTNRSLWVDEAMLAYSLTERGLGNLTSGVFEWVQSAPVIYLYVVKIITLIGGNSEFTLRLWSFIAYIGILFCSYYISGAILRVKFPLMAVAFISNLPSMIYFASEFKPYITDVLSIMLVIIFYYRYQEKKINLYVLAVIYAFILWLSNPCCFFIAGIWGLDSVNCIIRKEYKEIKKYILAGLIIFVSFIVYYLYWLKPVIDAGDMTEYWENSNFCLVPTSMEDVYGISTSIKEILYTLNEYRFIILGVVLIGAIYNIFVEKNKYINRILGGLFITLVASWLGMYPVTSRLYLYFTPLLVILFFFYIDKLYSKKKVLNAIVLAVSLFFVFSTKGFIFYHNKDNHYRILNETNPALDYIEDHVRSGDKVFIYNYAVPGFYYKYRDKTDKASIGSYKNNVILAEVALLKYSNTNDLDTIVNNTPIYILTSHSANNTVNMNPLIDSLIHRGNLDLVYEKYNTYVYYYTIKDSIR